MIMKLINPHDAQTIAENVEIAGSLVKRLVGLIGRHDFADGQAFIIPGCRQVHTFFMRFPIDVVFVDKNYKVLRTSESIKPYSTSCYCFKAVHAVELPAGTVASHKISLGSDLLLTG